MQFGHADHMMLVFWFNFFFPSPPPPPHHFAFSGMQSEFIQIQKQVFHYEKSRPHKRQSCCFFENKEFPAGNFPNSYMLCMHVCVCVCACVHVLHACVCLDTCLNACTFLCAVIHVCVCVYVYRCMSLSVHVCILCLFYLHFSSVI